MVARFVSIAASLLFLAGCASTETGGRSLNIAAASGGRAVEGARCEVRTDSRNWTIITPATIDPGPPDGNLTIVCDKPGYRTAELVFRAAGTAGSGAGLSIGGGSGGVGVGLSFPIGRRGMAPYPPALTVEMTGSQP